MCDCSPSKHFDEKARVLANEQLGPRLYKITLAAPRMARVIRPGQFVHMQLPGMEAHILRRPFSVYRSNVQDGTIEIDLPGSRRGHGLHDAIRRRRRVRFDRRYGLRVAAC